MTFQYPRSGPNNVAEYQAAGLPWVTSSNVTAQVWRIDFPYVTNHIIALVHTGSVRLGFTENGVNGVGGSNYIIIESGNSYPSMPIRCKTLFVRSNTTATGSLSLMVGLTTIDPRTFPTLTGSAVYNSASIGSSFGYGLPLTPGSGSGLG
jgi:hypothetical protein